MSLDARCEIVSGTVSLVGVADMSVLNNDGFGVKNQLAETAWKYGCF